MRQYTTPVVQLRIDGHTVSGDVYVTFANKARNVMLTIIDTIADMICHAESGYGVKEVGGQFVYAEVPVAPEPDPDPEEALSILLGGVDA